jgi:hypothetical protein
MVERMGVVCVVGVVEGTEVVVAVVAGDAEESSFADNPRLHSSLCLRTDHQNFPHHHQPKHARHE